MKSTEQNKCKTCGAAITSENTDRICPACLLSGALGNTTESIATKPDQCTQSLTETKNLQVTSSGRSRLDNYPRTFGPYRLLGLLGQGGMGAVYEAEQMDSGRRVALKMLDHQLDSPEMRQRFLREGRLAASVRHPNSLYIFGSEEVEDQPVITMEIAGSGTLKDQLKKQGPLPIPEAVDAILDVIAGLEEACAGGVLHRDIKPSNCFVYPDGSVKVGDFGLSVSTMGAEDSYVTATGVIMGTPAYASPEQLRGDDLDVRADIYSVGATLYTLLTGKAPFEGRNAVQVVANAINQKPTSLCELRADTPPVLAQVVARCLAKEPAGRYADYSTLREALLPFSSKVPEPASLKQRMAAGWIDFIAALLIPYMALLFSVNLVEFHFGMFAERTLYSARFYLTFICFGLLYFTLTEGIFGAGLGKWAFGLRVVRTNGRHPGLLRGLTRIVIPIATCEIPRMVLLFTTLSVTNLQEISVMDNVLLIGASNVLPWLTVLLTLTSRPENNFATVWDLLSGTRVVFVQKSVQRPSVESIPQSSSIHDYPLIGPFQINQELVAEDWKLGTDPLLRRPVWLRRRRSEITETRRHVARPGRLRWLQEVISDQGTWDVFEAAPGMAFSKWIESKGSIPWSTLRHWLHDLATECWAGSKDGTLPEKVSFDYIRITSQGVILLDEPDPEITPNAPEFSMKDIRDHQAFLSEVAKCVEPTSVPVHARSILNNLHQLKFEKLSFLTGALNGLLQKRADVPPSLRVMSTFLLPLYTGILIFIGMFNELKEQYGAFHSMVQIILGILATACVIQLLALPIRWIWSHHVFGLELVDVRGEPANPILRFKRWLIVWLPLFVPIMFLHLSRSGNTSMTDFTEGFLLLIWFSTALYGTVIPKRGWHDRLAGTWIVKR